MSSYDVASGVYFALPDVRGRRHHAPREVQAEQVASAVDPPDGTPEEV